MYDDYVDFDDGKRGKALKAKMGSIFKGITQQNEIMICFHQRVASRDEATKCSQKQTLDFFGRTMSQNYGTKVRNTPGSSQQ